jgi:demethylmenaquinone methyltransferase/2-methoxy-6-polyprenyl-1,4-benzoquinol methylase
VDNRELTPVYARCLIRLIRPFPNFDFFFIKSLRRKAVRLLQLEAGNRVLDVGCGPGGSLQYLLNAVGATGEVVGVEISPEVTLNAQRRIEKNHWTNVRVLTASAENVQLTGKFDALLMFAAHDVYTSPQALANLLPHLNDGARVVIFGAKLLRQPAATPFNAFFRAMFSRLTFATTAGLTLEPWKPLEERIGTLTIAEHWHGLMFLAWGSVNASKNRRSM